MLYQPLVFTFTHFIVLMFFALLFFIVLGCGVGIATGLIPGVHPNLVVLVFGSLVGVFFGLYEGLVFLVSMAVTNSITDFIPSTILGAPDGGTELSVLPGHRMLLAGHGYHAIKLTVIGGMLSLVFVAFLLPAVFFGIPTLFLFLRPYTGFLLLAIVGIMLFSEQTYQKKLLASFCFLCSGIIGLFSQALPIDSNVLLFPLLSGLFGTSVLLLQVRTSTHLPLQRPHDAIHVQRVHKSVFFGTLGGVLSGLLPGVGSSQIATLATVENNDHAFLLTVGALTTSNIILSILSLLLIGRGRSGVAVAISAFVTIGMMEFLIILAACFVACGIACVATLWIAKRFLVMMSRVNYTLMSSGVLLFIVLIVLLLCGVLGVFLLALCTSLGIFANCSGIKRGNLMGVLLLPTILFFLPI